jgi:hypothetical protein
MKQIKGYLLNKETGAGVSGKAVSFTKLDGSLVTISDTLAQNTSSVTAADGSFYGNFELSPGPINVTVTAAADEIKKRISDEKAEFGYQWSSDISRIARGQRGVISGFLNELAVSVPAGHTIRIATGGAIFNGGVFTIEMGNQDIAGTANTNASISNRVDLVTLRQYNEDAAGQLAGKQQIVVTLGTTTGVAPAIPTGTDFEDLPIAEVHTAYNASTSTVVDRRQTTGASKSFYQAIPSSGNKKNLGFFTAATLTISGLDPEAIYDGILNIELPIVSYSGGANVAITQWKLTHNKSWLRPATITDKDISGDLVGYGNFPTRGHLSLSFPIVGLTGVTSETYPLSVRVVGGADSYIQGYIGGYSDDLGYIQAVLTAR